MKHIIFICVIFISSFLSAMKSADKITILADKGIIDHKSKKIVLISNVKLSNRFFIAESNTAEWDFSKKKENISNNSKKYIQNYNKKHLFEFLETLDKICSKQNEKSICIKYINNKNTNDLLHNSMYDILYDDNIPLLNNKDFSLNNNVKIFINFDNYNNYTNNSKYSLNKHNTFSKNSKIKYSTNKILQNTSINSKKAEIFNDQDILMKKDINIIANLFENQGVITGDDIDILLYSKNKDFVLLKAKEKDTILLQINIIY
ncbi:hypothetical protein [Lyticum sinuosum]|uniref:Uncharacterized protein n=1 Tax=Lyticum sinuosum TaxID=1332059 RepID=A0AAE4VK41_9RICK|nr:hypothetical protein [Lyticum sinuosum]MDZ5761440.1 hypothetical protein [Lyticum sinuosum]